MNRNDISTIKSYKHIETSKNHLLNFSSAQSSFENFSSAEIRSPTASNVGILPTEQGAHPSRSYANVVRSTVVEYPTSQGYSQPAPDYGIVDHLSKPLFIKNSQNSKTLRNEVYVKISEVLCKISDM